MVSIFDFDSFSNKLRTLRKSLGYTILDVSNSTGINQSTIKQLENGKNIPRIDTIQILSSFYKCDLLSLLIHGVKDNTTNSYFYKIGDLSTRGNTSELQSSLNEITEHLQSQKFTPIENKDLVQLKLYVEGLIFASSPNSEAAEAKASQLQAILKYQEALKLGNSNHTMDNFEFFKYTAAEMSILFSMAVSYGLIRECLLSNKIMFFVYDLIHALQESVDAYKLLLSKLLFTVAYNYHRMDMDEKALDYAEKGINYCIESDTSIMLPSLLLRKGIAKKLLHMDDWKKPIEQAIVILTLQNKTDLAKIFENLLTKDT